MKRDLDLTLEQEKFIWFQKSREQWLTCEDRNSKFFHTTTTIKRRMIRVVGLMIAVDNWVEDKDIITSHAVEFFHALFSMSDLTLLHHCHLSIEETFSELPITDWSQLEKPISMTKA